VVVVDAASHVTSKQEHLGSLLGVEDRWTMTVCSTQPSKEIRSAYYTPIIEAVGGVY
jgi:hypothetical protein